MLIFFSACASKTVAINNLEDAKKMDDLQTQIKILENRLDHVTDQMNVMRDAMETMQVKSEQAKSDYVPLDETQTNATLKVASENFLGVGQLKPVKQAKWTNADLKNKYSRAVKTKAAPTKNKIKKTNKALNLYNSAYKLYQVGEYKTARKSFLDFLNDYPKHTYADNALFWLAESYYNESNCPQALLYYERVLSEYPQENKIPESLYKKTACLIKTSQEDEAKQSLLSLIKTYPGHPSTQKAKKKFLAKLVN
ncbi:tol-pal system protein YbgF [bacterium]|nr:tol-pal system protein YbgF [bacterium]